MITSTTDSISIVIADDHEIFREGFISMLRKEKSVSVVGQAKNGLELVALVKEKRPSIAFADISMPELDGIEATRKIKELYPETGVIALSMFNDDNLIIDMLKAGASGYLLKNTSIDELRAAITSVNSGGTYYCNDTSLKIVRLVANNQLLRNNKNTDVCFTDREIEIMQLMCEQLTIKEIGDRIGLSPRTVETYRQALQEKTGSKNSVGVVVYAIKHKIVSP
jgi:DNA-binding NarL/FixJ family response regulator